MVFDMSVDDNCPDLEWYQEQSRNHGVSVRCPFAHLRRCPRFFFSRSLLGQHGSTPISKEEDAELMVIWENSDSVPLTAEEQPGVGSSGDKSSFFNFCPEVLGEAFSWFASDLARHADKIDEAAAYDSLQRRGITKSPHYIWYICRPLHYLECSTYSLLDYEHKNSEPASPNSIAITENDIANTNEPWWKRSWVLTWIAIGVTVLGAAAALL